jgi:hypothetical protein
MLTYILLHQELDDGFPFSFRRPDWNRSSLDLAAHNIEVFIEIIRHRLHETIIV